MHFANEGQFEVEFLKTINEPRFKQFLALFKRGAFDSAKNHKRQHRKRLSVTAKREVSQTPKFV